jgi:hypothetical protein
MANADSTIYEEADQTKELRNALQKKILLVETLA